MQSIVLLVLALCPLLAYSASIRGLNPDLADKYTGAGGVFSCLDGLKKISFAHVNDDYCDCADGSDEPGTAACHNGRFYCRNLGSEPKLLSSSFVDDGICDCCDGADEARGKCQNTCLAESAHRREEMQKEVDQYAAALVIKAGYIAKAAEAKARLSGKVDTIDTEIQQQQERVDQLRAERDRLEAEETKKRMEEYQAREAAALKAREEREAAEQQQQQQQAEQEAGEVHDELQAGHEAHVERELAEHEETDEERGRRIASQWTHDPEAALPSEGGAEVSGEEHEHEDGEEEEEEEHYDGEHHYDHDEHEYDASGQYTGTHHEDAASPAAAARTALHEAEQALHSLQKDKEHIARFLQSNLDLGPSDVFLPLGEHCHHSYQTRWTYEACFFGDAVQSEGHNNRVTVGRWQGFDKDYTVAVFANGDECWNVGPRSFTVSMTCGHHNKLHDADEPETCKYAAKMTTPAACSEAELERLKDALRRLEEQEKEIAALIAQEAAGGAPAAAAKDEL